MSNIRSEFQHRCLNPEGLARTTKIREAFTALLETVEWNVPAGGPRSVSITKLQEACTWAVRGVAEDPGACLPDPVDGGA